MKKQPRPPSGLSYLVCEHFSGVERWVCVNFSPEVLYFTFCEMSVKCRNKSNADKNFIACQKCAKNKNNRPRGLAVAFPVPSVLYQKCRDFGTLLYWNLHGNIQSGR